MPSIAEIYQAHASSVYWSAYSITHNESTALDVMQSVFVRALEHERTLISLAEGQQKAWLYTATRNASIDQIRKQRREVALEEPTILEAEDDAALPEDFAVTKEMRETVAAAVDRLPEPYRQPILLYYFADMKHNEIATYLGEKDSTIRTRIKRAKARLYKILQEGGELLG